MVNKMKKSHIQLHTVGCQKGPQRYAVYVHGRIVIMTRSKSIALNTLKKHLGTTVSTH